MSNALTIPASWLDDAVEVLLVGCGGTGSEMLDELFRIHTLLVKLGGKGLSLTAVDPDKVSEANIGRQRFWPCDLGFDKAEVLISRVNSYGGADWNFAAEKYAPDDHCDHYFDILITCVDTPKVRAEIGEYYSGVETYQPRFWLDCGNDNHSGNVILGGLGWFEGEQLLPNVYDLYPVLADMDNGDSPSCSTVEALEKQDYGVNRAVAREGANLIWQLLRHGKIEHHGSYIDIKAGTVQPLAIDPAIWETFKTTH